MAEHFKKNTTFFDVILDEGGAITEGMIPTVSAKSAVVAVHEKSRHLYKCTTKQETKGHGGLNPTTDNAIVRLAKFISAVDKAKIYKGKFYPEVKATFSNHVPFMKFPMNILFGNIGLFAPLLKKAMLSIPTTNAMLSTSISFTTIFAGSKEDPQMKAKEAYTTMFLRCIREDDLFRGLEKIKEIGKKFGVEIEEIERDYCKPTDFTKRPYKILEECLNENFRMLLSHHFYSPQELMHEDLLILPIVFFVLLRLIWTANNLRQFMLQMSILRLKMSANVLSSTRSLSKYN